MVKTFLVAVVILLFLSACGQTQTFCDICGVNHSAEFKAGLNGASSHHAFFEVFAPDSNEYLRVFVESCWAGSIAPQFRLHFIARYEIAELYTAISNAESNVPFGITLDGETITLTTDISGLEEVFITLNENYRAVGFAYNMTRRE
jgi:hypothetical protein